MHAWLVIERLMFRSPDGSLAFAGYWAVGVGVLMVIGSVVNILGRGWAKRFPPSIPRFAVVAWGCLGVVAGSCFVVLPFFAAAGKYY